MSIYSETLQKILDIESDTTPLEHAIQILFLSEVTEGKPLTEEAAAELRKYEDIRLAFNNQISELDALKARLDVKDVIMENETIRPEQIEYPDLTSLRELCQQYMDDVSKGSYVDEDFEHYIFEAALMTMFGANVFEYVNRMRNK